MTKQRAQPVASAAAPAKAERPKIPTTEQVSAGGVVVRGLGSSPTGSTPEVAIVAVLPSRRWQLPKGLVDAGETPEQAALREVREEAGIDAEIVGKIEMVEYWYVGHTRGERIRYHKFVHFYLMRYVGGDIADHDHEVAEVHWVSPDEAQQLLAFKGEQTAVQQAAALLSKMSQP